MSGRSSATRAVIRKITRSQKEIFPTTIIFTEGLDVPRMGGRSVRYLPSGGITFKVVSVSRMTEEERKEARVMPIPQMLSD